MSTWISYVVVALMIGCQSWWILDLQRQRDTVLKQLDDAKRQCIPRQLRAWDTKCVGSKLSGLPMAYRHAQRLTAEVIAEELKVSCVTGPAR